METKYMRKTAYSGLVVLATFVPYSLRAEEPPRLAPEPAGVQRNAYQAPEKSKKQEKSREGRKGFLDSIVKEFFDSLLYPISHVDKRMELSPFGKEDAKKAYVTPTVKKEQPRYNGPVAPVPPAPKPEEKK